MPIFGGLNKYVVIEVDNFKDHWHVGWCGVKIQLNKLKIYDNRLKLLYGKGPYKVFAMDDRGNMMNVKIVGDGKIGDGKYDGIRLF